GDDHARPHRYPLCRCGGSLVEDVAGACPHRDPRRPGAHRDSSDAGRAAEMTRPAAMVCLFLMTARPAAAQSVSGNADWGYARAAYRTESSTTEDGAFTQAYTLGYSSSLWDPRFAIYSGGLTFNRNALSFGSDTSQSEQTGFNAAASLFSMRPFRLSLHANRAVGGESANYPASSGLRSGLAVPIGVVPEL